MSGLTTHVLDLTAGRPAAGVAIRLFAREGASWIERAETHTDGDGRAKLLIGSSVAVGAYRLEFDIGPHFRASGAAAAEPGFLETVVIDFTVTDPEVHYHVPLLVSPFGYSTYRGS
jgi:5-hydroxyisourate hydrolase